MVFVSSETNDFESIPSNSQYLLTLKSLAGNLPTLIVYVVYGTLAQGFEVLEDFSDSENPQKKHSEPV